MSFTFICLNATFTETESNKTAAKQWHSSDCLTPIDDWTTRCKVQFFNVKCFNLALPIKQQSICNSQDCACAAPHSSTQFLPLRVRREGLEDPNDKQQKQINNTTTTVITSTLLWILTIQRVVIHLRGEHKRKYWSPSCYSKLTIQTPWPVGIGLPATTSHVQVRTGQPTEKKKVFFSLLWPITCIISPGMYVVHIVLPHSVRVRWLYVFYSPRSFMDRSTSTALKSSRSNRARFSKAPKSFRTRKARAVAQF